MTKHQKSKSKIANIFRGLCSKIVSYSTFGAALVALFTLVHLRSEHRTSIQPEIVINSSNYLCFCENYSNGYVNFNITNGLIDSTAFFYRKSLNDFQIKPSALNNSLNLSVKNIGRGVAKNLELSWEIDQDHLIAIFNKYPGYSITDTCYIEEDESVFVLGMDTLYRGFRVEPGSSKVNYLLPVESEPENNAVTIKIPDYYIFLYTRFSLLEAIVRSKSGLEEILEEEFPDIFLTIAYRDISNNNYKKQYKIRFEPSQGMGGYDRITELAHWNISGLLLIDNI